MSTYTWQGFSKIKNCAKLWVWPWSCKVKHVAVSRAGPQRMQVIKGGGGK